MVKIQTTGKQFVITIPKEIMKNMNWKVGDDLFMSKDIGRDMVYMIKNG